MAHARRLIFPVLTLLISLALIGCANNTEPFSGMTQQNKGPESPTKIENNFVMVSGDAYFDGTRHAPSSQPATNRAEDTAKGTQKLKGEGNAGDGVVSAEGPAHGRTHSQVIWVDVGAKSSPSVGSMNPNASQNNPTTAEQKPEASVQASVPVNVGPASSSNSTMNQAYKGNADAGAVSQDMSGDRILSWLKTQDANTLKSFLQTIQGFIQSKIGGAGTSATSQPTE